VKNPTLAQWLEHCADFVAQLNDPLAPAVFEGVLHCAATGDTVLMESVFQSARAAGQSAASTLNSVYMTRLVIWNRLEAELEPEQAWDFLLLLELIFQHITQSLLTTFARRAAPSPTPADAPAALTIATELARANRELARLEQAKTDFISIAAHELKTPLTVLQGYVDILREQDPAILLTNGNRIVHNLGKSTRRMATIINALLDISALETGNLPLNPAPTSLDALVRITLEQVQQEAASRRHIYQLEIAPNLPLVTTDSERVHQVLHQLLINAAKFTPDGGTITVSVLMDSPDSVKIKIADTGIGIAPEDRGHVFDKFFRVGEARLHSTGAVKFKGAGTGLGLALAEGIVHALGGKIWVDSPGYDEINLPGSTFTVELPLRARK